MRIAQWVLPLINWNSYFAFPGVQPDGCPARPAVPAIDQKLKNGERKWCWPKSRKDYIRLHVTLHSEVFFFHRKPKSKTYRSLCMYSHTLMYNCIMAFPSLVLFQLCASGYPMHCDKERGSSNHISLHWAIEKFQSGWWAALTALSACKPRNSQKKRGEKWKQKSLKTDLDESNIWTPRTFESSSYVCKIGNSISI